MRDFRIANEVNAGLVDASAHLLVQPRLWVPHGDYPAHREWADKALAEIRTDRKRAMVAWWGSDEAGLAVYQRDPIDPTKVEIRNLSIEPSARGRGLAPFLLRQLECEAPHDFPGATTLVTDIKRTNLDMLAFALRQGFRVKTVAALAGNFAHNGVEDVVLTKSLPVASGYEG